LRSEDGALGGYTPGSNEEDDDRGFALLEKDECASELCARGVNGELAGVETCLFEGVAGE
jgi:hypothetical protein